MSFLDRPRFSDELRVAAAYSDAAFALYVSDLWFPPHLREATAFAQANEKGLVLMPRGHAKTTLFIHRAARRIGQTEGRRRLGVLTAVDDDANARSGAIRAIVASERFAQVFPWARRGVVSNHWTDDHWTVRGAEDAVGKDYTVRAMGLRSVRAGARLDDLLADDMVGLQENATPGQREHASRTYWSVVDPMVAPGGTRWFLGTTWHEDDVYAELIRKGWPSLVKRAIEDGQPLWPEQWPLTALDAKRLEMGTALYNLQYQNDPSGMGGNIFKRDWFRYVDALPERGWRRVGVDLASSSKERSDFTAAGELYEDTDHNLYICGSYADRLDEGHRQWLTGMRRPPDSLVEVPEAIGSESPRLLWPLGILPPGFAGATEPPQIARDLAALNIEAIAHQSTFVREVLNNTGLPASPVYPDKDKVTRARALAARYEAGKVFHLRGAPGLDAYEQEAVSFPNGPHDDRVDAMVYAADLNPAATEFYWTSARW
jgi:phage terminase large subunit-like protein